MESKEAIKSFKNISQLGVLNNNFGKNKYCKAINEHINGTLPKIAITDFQEDVLNFVKIHSINCQIQNKMKADSTQFDTKFAN